jgi:hypothetical protein
MVTHNVGNKRREFGDSNVRSGADIEKFKPGVVFQDEAGIGEGHQRPGIAGAAF